MSPCEACEDEGPGYCECDNFNGCVWCGTETEEHDKRCLKYLWPDRQSSGSSPAPATPEGDAADE